jgi:hypothetical protein
MKKDFLRNIRHVEKLLTRFLLVGLLLSLTPANGARNVAGLTEKDSGTAAIRTGNPLIRNYALTVITGQRTAGDISKSNRVRYPAVPDGLALRVSVVAPNAVQRFLVATARSVSYLSFRSSRPGGRAPPVSA